MKRILFVIAFILTLQSLGFAQASNSSMPGAGTRRPFTLFGDLKVDESQAGDANTNVIFDVILYTRGNEVFARQRVGNNGRYRFNNVFNGDYYLAVELDSVEIARMPVLISQNSIEQIRQDLEFRWKGPARAAAGVVAVGDDYKRSSKNSVLYQRAAHEIDSKNFTQAIATLRSVVEADPKDYPAWSALGMVYFVQKDLEAAENSYNSAIQAKPDHVAALVNLGRVRLARKNNEGAIEPLEAALKADPQSATANYFLGEAYLALKKGSKAVGYLNEALKLDPIGMADAHLRLGALYNVAGYKDRAAAEYEQFLQKKPDYPEKKKLMDYIEANKPKP
ncbi:MAG TPA: tetratricopeptide repeat protein [Pyrinomonadaceae bacterium]|nr:tetratricopeptide repeat protein [Pyrinomonadaceae bacterium]